MNTEQERTAFEAWYEKQMGEAPRIAEDMYAPFATACWEAYQAGRAVLQSQDREDADRIQFMTDEACTFNTWKQEDGSWKYRLEWEYGAVRQTEWFSTPEESIDHARRAEENK